jgi:hypothetical protein
LEAFLSILGNDRPLGPPEQIEIHALFEKGDATTDYLQRKFKLIIPSGQTVTLYRWIEKPGGHDFHNRYILTDIGGVSLQHGLDAGAAGQIDDINRLEREQYEYHCSNYDFKSTTFDLAETPTQIIGTK